MRGHSGAVVAVKVSDGVVVSASQDHTLRMWDIENADCLAIYRSYGDEITALDFTSSTIISGDGSGVVAGRTDD